MVRKAMKAIRIQVDRTRPDAAAIAEAGRILAGGGLVAFPTETVYGLGGNALDPGASAKIYAAKGRPSDNPLIVHIADWADLPAIVTKIPAAARRLGEAFWPGPLTMIFEKSSRVPAETTGGLQTVAVRFPSHPVARALIKAAGGYVAAPSANLSGRPSPTKADHVEEDLGERIDMILDGGEVDIGLESTIVDFTEETPVILRPGYISKEEMQAVIGEIRVDRALIASDSRVKPKAPGMKYRHYAPKGTLLIVEGEQDAVSRKIRALVREQTGKGRKTAVLCAAENAAQYTQGRVIPLGHLSKEEEIAQHLFDALRQLDEEGIEAIYSEAFYTQRIGAAIMNRLLKAAGHQRIQASEDGA